MGRSATIATGNVWYEARKKAALYDDRLKSREGAAELLGMSVSAVSDAELDNSKCMPVDKAKKMAELYKAPHLLNYYCTTECPLQGCGCVSDEHLTMEQSTLRFLKLTKPTELAKIRETLLDVASGENVSDDTLADLIMTQEYLMDLAKTISALSVCIKEKL